jgi:hypothetical protein
MEALLNLSESLKAEFREEVGIKRKQSDFAALVLYTGE